MKKILFAVIVGAALLFGGCKKMISTEYTIGCLGYQINAINGSNWDELQTYFSSHVKYNKLVTFESTSLAENDAKAKELLDEQLKLIDTEYVCSLIHGEDYFDYGIATINAGGDYKYIKVVRFKEYGTYEITY